MGQTWSHGFSAALILHQLLRDLSRSSAYIANAALPSSASAPAFHTLTDQPVSLTSRTPAAGSYFMNRASRTRRPSPVATLAGLG